MLDRRREQPWETRRVGAEHFQWFQNLFDLHALTEAWIREFRELNGKTKRLARGELSSEVLENFWVLEQLASEYGISGVGKSTDEILLSLLDDTSPEDLLARLERSIWTVQAWTLDQIVTHSSGSKSERAALVQQLEGIAWRGGRDCAQARWPELGEDARSDLRGIFSAFQNSPFSGFPRTSGFLVQRAVSNDLRLELLVCPHESPFSEVQESADLLCSMHAQWLRGFAYALNTTVSLVTKRENRCLQHWSL